MKKCTSLALALLLTLGAAAPQSVLATTEVAKVNWSNEDGTYYALNESNEKIRGWIKDEFDCWYFLDYKSAAMKKGWVAGDATHWYYLNPSNGIMQTGWKTIDGKQFYFETKGKLAGAMVTGTVEIEGVKHDFRADGSYIGKTGAVVQSQNKGEPLYSGYAKIDALVDEILAKIIKSGMSEMEELRAIHDYVVLNTTYGGKWNSTYELPGSKSNEEVMGKLADGLKYVGEYSYTNKSEQYYFRTYMALRDHGGLCNDYNGAFNTLADALGYRTSMMDGSYNGSGHQCSIVWFNGKWRIVDTQLDDYKDEKMLDIGFMVDYDKQTGFRTSKDCYPNEKTYYVDFDWNSSEDYFTQTSKNDYIVQPENLWMSYDEMLELCVQTFHYSRNK